jgi:hypothetical protein
MVDIFHVLSMLKSKPSPPSSRSYWRKLIVLAHHRKRVTSMVDWSDFLRRSLLQISPESQPPSCDEFWLGKYLSPGPSRPATLLLNSFFDHHLTPLKVQPESAAGHQLGTHRQKKAEMATTPTLIAKWAHGFRQPLGPRG